MEEVVNKGLLSEEEYADLLLRKREEFVANVKKGVLYLHDYSGVRKYKSVRRAIKRGHMSVFGDLYPRRPFNNRKSSLTILKRKIYESIKGRV